MLTCPLCKMDLPAPAPRCPRCQTDLSLLSDFVTDLKTLLDKADAHRRAGEIAAAVETYLAVLDVDPTNDVARAALGPVLLGLRAADRTSRRKPWLTIVLVTMGFLSVLSVTLIAFKLGFWVCLRMFQDLAPKGN
jgi:hypothetical protein